MKNDLKIKYLNKVLDYFILQADDSDKDICQKCVYLPTSIREKIEDLADGVEPCIYRREKGVAACRNGIVEYFSKRENK